MNKPLEDASDKPALLGDIRDDEVAMRKVIAMLGHRAELARKNPAEFFTFVLREEHTRLPLKLAPHQKVLFDFVMYHEKCILMLPVGHSKTFCMGALALWLLGHDPSMRGAIISAAEAQSQKCLSMVRDYIETSAELRLVFPKLVKSPQEGHSWTQSAITIARPMGIKDHSLMALGAGSKVIMGSRLNFILIDDILNQENTSSPEQRQSIYTWVDSSVLSRLDPKGSKVVICNTAWHSRDLVHDLMNMPPDKDTGAVRAWPTLKMSATGEIRIYNTDFGYEGKPGCDDLRDGFPVSVGSRVDPEMYHSRLTAHDPDPNNEQTLFPMRFPKEVLEQRRLAHASQIEFSRAYLNEVRNDADAYCKKEWITKALMAGRGMTLAMNYTGQDATFTGVDLAMSQREGADSTAFFTFRVLQDGRRLILDVEMGKYDAPTIIKKIQEKGEAYNSIVTVENNGGQELLRQMAQAHSNIPIKAYTTGRTKAHPEFGVQGLFNELEKGAWIIPCNHGLETNRHVKRWIEECLEYTPSAHTGDALMACFFAREQAKAFGLSWGNSVSTGNGGANIGAGIMSR